MAEPGETEPRRPEPGRPLFERLLVLSREAEVQIAWIDRHAPSHRLSTATARLYQHPGGYAMLVRQVAGHEQMVAPHGRAN
jgi:hypothetical protein